MKYDESGININTFNLLFSTNKKINANEESGTLKQLKNITALDLYTQMNHKNLFEILSLKSAAYQFRINLNDIKYNKESQKHEYHLENGQIITFNLLSNQIDSTNKNILKELESKKRHGKCHIRSIELGCQIENSVILTGTITIMNHKYLHSVVETINNKNEPIILDWTRNLEIDKDSYINLFNFDVISTIPPQKFYQNIDIFKQLNFNTIPYLIFRNELMKDTLKNPQIFFPKEEGKTLIKKVNN